jgi:proteic killer suppression protein
LTYNASRYALGAMIRSSKCKETEKVFRREFPQKLPLKMQRIAFRKLGMLNRSVTLNDIRVPPGNRLEKLHGERKGQYSVRVNENSIVSVSVGATVMRTM